MLRVRSEEAKRKVEQEEITQRPNKAKCEREERMAEVQLKAYWTCYPLHPNPMRLEISKMGNPETGQARDAGKVKDESNTRKHLLKILRSSIEAQGQADAKGRKCPEAEPNPKNSRAGEDPKILNWDCKVEGTKDDLHQTEFHKWEFL